MSRMRSLAKDLSAGSLEAVVQESATLSLPIEVSRRFRRLRRFVSSLLTRWKVSLLANVSLFLHAGIQQLAVINANRTLLYLSVFSFLPGTSSIPSLPQPPRLCRFYFERPICNRSKASSVDVLGKRPASCTNQSPR